MAEQKNVLGGPLQVCCTSPMAGYYRDGSCRVEPGSEEKNTLCAEVTEDFLEFTRMRGNDLLTPNAELDFPGLKPGDRYCLCPRNWNEAFKAGVAPPVVLEATHLDTLESIDLDDLQSHAIDGKANIQ